MRPVFELLKLPPDGSWVLTSNTTEATLGGAPARPGDDKLLRIELALPT